MSGPEQLTLDGRAVPHDDVVRGPSTSRMVRRPVRAPGIREDTHSMIADLGRAVAAVCDRAGIAPGEAFYVSRVPPAPPASLDGDGQARRSDPQTSKRAAKDVPPKRGSQRGRVLAALADDEAGTPPGGAWGMTAIELVDATGIPYRSVTPRIGELKRWGYVDATGTSRLGDMGAEQEIIAMTDKGRAMAAALARGADDAA